ncbi:MAG: preQ(1) synthase [Acidobacteria bacterium]|nr:preQ(1) synthase [Acidobacteriota bacterium]
MPLTPSRDLETVPNPAPDRPYRIRMVAPEFTCLCPRTGQPDFAAIEIDYVPGPRLVELKSLKRYLWSWRDEGIFHEAVTNRVLEDLVQALDPAWLRVTGHFKVRGGITTVIAAQHGIPPAGMPDCPLPQGD